MAGRPSHDGMLWEVLEQACPEGEKLFVVLDSVEMLEPPHSDGLASTIRALRGFSGDGITVIDVASKVGREPSGWPFAAASSVAALSVDKGQRGIRATVEQPGQVNRSCCRTLPLNPQTFSPN